VSGRREKNGLDDKNGLPVNWCAKVRRLGIFTANAAFFHLLKTNPAKI
jgi:hypothetical protein